MRVFRLQSLALHLAAGILVNDFQQVEPQFPHRQHFSGLLRGLKEVMHKHCLACCKQQGLALSLHFGSGDRTATAVEVALRPAAGKGPPAFKFSLACPAWEISNKN